MKLSEQGKIEFYSFCIFIVVLTIVLFPVLGPWVLLLLAFIPIIVVCFHFLDKFMRKQLEEDNRKIEEINANENGVLLTLTGEQLEEFRKTGSTVLDGKPISQDNVTIREE